MASTDTTAKFPPSRDTAGRRSRALRALTRELDASIGPDGSEIFFEYHDGWSVRRVTTLQDQRREGRLMNNCLRNVIEVDPNVFSLRDEGNIPHLTFSAWCLSRYDRRRDTIPLGRNRGALSGLEFMMADDALLLVHISTRPFTDKRREQLNAFAATRVDRLPEYSRDAAMAAVYPPAPPLIG